MKIIEILDDTVIENDTIKDRIVQSKKNGWSIHYLVKDNETEIAFLSLDLMRKDPPLRKNNLIFIYELFVITAKRKKGYGSKILDWVFEKAKKDSFDEVWCEPHPFDGSVTLNILNKFYINKGFKGPDGNSQFVKKIYK